MPTTLKLDGYNIGSWASQQRTAKDSMPPERKQRLDDIGFVWDVLAEAWEEGFSKLLEFKEAEGHCKVPRSYHIDGTDLGQWVRFQRDAKDKMPPERRQRLDDIGFVRRQSFWNRGMRKSCKATTSGQAKNWRPRCIDTSGSTTSNSCNQPWSASRPCKR